VSASVGNLGGSGQAKIILDQPPGRLGACPERSRMGQSP